MRAILYLVATVVAIGLLRGIIGMIAKAFSDFSSPSPGPAQSKRPPVPVAEALKQDPVCGTFIALSSSVQKTVAGTTYYFCSPACRDKFKAA